RLPSPERDLKPVAERKRPKSKYTKDRSMPGAFEGETVTRRRLMTGVVHGGGALAVMGFTLPVLGFAAGTPLFERPEASWPAIGGNGAGVPPVRPLDRCYTRVRDGQLEIGPRYSVNGEFTRFPSYRDPGQDLDGIGQFMYPGRFSTPKG